MNTDEIKALLKECRGLYSNYKSMYEDEAVISEWHNTLSKYDRNDIYASLERHKEGAYSRNPIGLADLIRNVPTKQQKTLQSLKGIKTYCKSCGRLIDIHESEKHESRCRSTEYVITQYKKWFKKDITPSYLWSLSDDEFNAKYDILLKYIYDHTTDMREKKIIGYIFDPPNPEETRKMFNKEDNNAE